MIPSNDLLANRVYSFTMSRLIELPPYTIKPAAPNALVVTYMLLVHVEVYIRCPRERLIFVVFNGSVVKNREAIDQKNKAMI
jgi:hypothetical protein